MAASFILRSLRRIELSTSTLFASRIKPNLGSQIQVSTYNVGRLTSQFYSFNKCSEPGLLKGGNVRPSFVTRSMATLDHPEVSPVSYDGISSIPDASIRIKFKRPDKTARHIMQILDKEAVEEVKAQREIPDIQPGYIVQLKVEVPENKRRVSTLKGIVIAKRNAGLNSTFRIRRMVAGVGVESVFPLYSPNIKEMKVLDKKKVRRAKLYYLRDKMNALNK